MHLKNLCIVQLYFVLRHSKVQTFIFFQFVSDLRQKSAKRCISFYRDSCSFAQIQYTLHDNTNYDKTKSMYDNTAQATFFKSSYNLTWVWYNINRTCTSSEFYCFSRNNTFHWIQTYKSTFYNRALCDFFFI